MAEATRTKASGKGPEKEDRPLFRREHTVLPGPDGTVPAGADGAVIAEALHRGYRITGDAFVESIENHGHSQFKIVTWAVPVEKRN